MIIGVTGNFGSGKTTVASMFRRLGACVVDADKVCYSLMAPGKGVYKRIVRTFGKAILKKDRSIDRKKLGEIVFKSRVKLNRLNKIVHPEAIKSINKIIRAKKNRVVVMDAPLLVESGYYKKMDKLIVVRSSRKQSDTLGIIRMQASLKKKLALADFIIDNSGSKTKTLLQVRKIWKRMGV